MDFFLSQFVFPSIIFIFKIISAILSLFFLASIIILTRKIIKQNKISAEALVDAQTVTPEAEIIQIEKWQKLLSMVRSEDENARKMAIIEADQALDSLLIKKGFKGADMGERLKQLSENELSILDAVWQAHKIRNQIAHEFNFRIGSRQAEEVVKVYQKAIDELLS